MRDETCPNETILNEQVGVLGYKKRIGKLISCYWAGIVVVVIAFLLWAPRLSGPIDLRWDAGVYYVLGTSLATGHGYRILSEPGWPEALQYPPLLPAIVAVSQWVMGSTTPDVVAPWLRKLYFVIFVAYALATLALARRYLGPSLALTAAALCLLHFWTIFFSDLLFADLPLALVSIVFVLVAVDGPFASRPWLRETASFLLGAAGFLLRTAGVALLVAWVLDALARRQWRLAFVRSLLALLPIIAWQTYVARVQGSYEYSHPAYSYQRAPYQYYNVSYTQNVLLIDPFRPELGQMDAYAFVKRVAANLPSIVAAIGEGVSTRERWWRRFLKESQDQLFGRQLISSGVALAPIFGLAAIVLTGLVILVRQRAWLMAFIILGSIGLAWITPWPAQFTRYLITLAPFLAICVVLPLAKVGVLFHARHLRWTASLARTSFAGILVLAFATEIYTSLNSFRWRVTNKEAVVLPQSGNAAYRLFSHDHSWQAWEEAASWISAHAPSDAIIATSVPHFLYLRIGRRAVLPPMESDPVRARRLLEAVPISYVIVDTLAFLDVSRRYAFPAVQNDPATWRLVYSVRGADIYERATSRE